jgi:magnesium transporter
MGYYRAGLPVVDDEPGAPDQLQVLRSLHDRAVADPAGAFVWVGLSDPARAELAVVRDVFGLEWHEVEDAENVRLRPKARLDTEGGSVVLATLAYHEGSHQVTTGQMSVFYGPTFLVTVRHGAAPQLDELRERWAAEHRLRDHGTVGVVHAVMDLVVDEHLAVSERVHDEVERLEEAVFAPSRGDISAAIYLLKRENLEVRRAVSPLLPLATDLAHELLTGLPAGTSGAFRDVGEHLLRVGEQAESVDSLLLALMAAANAQVQLTQSADQRRMAAWAALALIPTMVGAVYGMNFAFMPELQWRFGYPALMAVMIVVMVLLYRRLKSAGWL